MIKLIFQLIFLPFTIIGWTLKLFCGMGDGLDSFNRKCDNFNKGRGCMLLVFVNALCWGGLISLLA